MLGRVLRRVATPVVSRSAVLTAALVDHPVAKYRSRHHLLRRLADRWGLPIYEEYVTWPSDPEVEAVWAAYPERRGRVLDRHFNLYHLARAVRDVPGATAECGVYRGRASWFVLAALDGRAHHVFDSFAGLSEPRAEDRPRDPSAFAWKKHILAAPEDVVRRNLARYADRVRLYPGWIPERFPEVAGETFAFVHLDVDLYEPTLASLEFFYPRLAPGAILVCDDFGFSTCPGAARAMTEFLRGRPEALVPMTTGQAWFLRRR